MRFRLEGGSGMATADFLAVILSALGVMVAILTFFLGVMAFFGWSAFKTVTEDKFDELVRKRFDANDPNTLLSSNVWLKMLVRVS